MTAGMQRARSASCRPGLCHTTGAFLLLALLSACSEPPPAPPPAAVGESPPATAPTPDDRPEVPAAPLPQPVEDTDEMPAPLTDPAATEAPDVPADGDALQLLGESIPPGTTRRLSWSAGAQYDWLADGVPVYVANGAGEGPTLCLTGAIHGDELNGIEMVRRVLHDLNPAKLKGAVIGVPIVNLQGFRRSSRYLPDRRDLNRFFPGNPTGSAASRIAHSLFDGIIRHCDGLVDIHTGSLSRTNLPQIRADLRNDRVREFASGFSGMVVLHSHGAAGTLRRAATDHGIPAVTLEAGEPGRVQFAHVREGVDGVFRLLDALGMVKRLHLLREPRPVYYRSTWVRSDHTGIMFSLVRLGQVVSAADVLATVNDPITGEQNLILSPVNGRVLGMALNQLVMPGFATFNIGIETDASRNGSLTAALEPPPSAAADGEPPAQVTPEEREEQERPE